MGNMCLLGLATLFATLCSAQQYSLQSSFAGPTFFDNFDFWTTGDPTYGYVHYVDQDVAEQYGMINFSPSDAAVWGVDTTQTLDPTANLGRLSIRLTSIQSWTHGLFILDLEHMPANQCGVWPAFWTLGSGVWPENGEINLIEFTNTVPNNQMALHTTNSPNCTIAGSGQTGTLLTHDCADGDSYTGCGVSATTPQTIGYEFDTAAGGVYAMEWTSSAIQIWFFPRGSVPASILEANDTVGPDPSTFGMPVANFQGSCDLDAHFYNHSVVFDTTFCGSYAGNLWAGAGCPLLDPSNGWQSCNDFVAGNPQAFTDAYWEVNYLNIYQTVAGAVATSSSVLSSVVPAAKTSSVPTLSGNAEGRPTTPTMPFPVGLASSTTSASSSVISLPTATSPAFTGPSTLVTSAISAPSSSTSSPMAASSMSLTSSMSSVAAGTTDVVVVVETITVTNPLLAIPSPQMGLARQEPMSVQDRNHHPRRQVIDGTTTEWPEPPPQAYQSSSTFTELCITAADSSGMPPGAPLTPPKCQSPRAVIVSSLPDATGVPEVLAVKLDTDLGERQILPEGTIGFCGTPGTSCNEHHRQIERQILPGGTIGFCGTPGSSCNEHHKREERQILPGGTIGFCGTPGSSCNEHQKRDERQILPGGTIGFCGTPGTSCNEHHKRDVAEGDAAVEADGVLMGSIGKRDFSSQESAAMAGSNAQVAERQVITDYSIVIITEVVTETVPAYTPTTFSFDPVTKRDERNLAKRDGGVTGVLAATSAEEPTGVDMPTSTAKAKHTIPYTCTPVVMLQAGGDPTQVGCLGPQHGLLPQTASLHIANVTSTITDAHATGHPKLANPNSLLSDLMDEVKIGKAVSVPAWTCTAVVIIVCVVAVLTW